MQQRFCHCSLVWPYARRGGWRSEAAAGLGIVCPEPFALTAGPGSRDYTHHHSSALGSVLSCFIHCGWRHYPVGRYLDATYGDRGTGAVLHTEHVRLLAISVPEQRSACTEAFPAARRFTGTAAERRHLLFAWLQATRGRSMHTRVPYCARAGQHD